MEEAGLEVRVDQAGNILGRMEGAVPGLPPLWVGSHIDSVPAGGNYDGPLGTLGALEGVRTVMEAGIRLRHPVDVVIFVNEEGGKTGSRVMAGEFKPEELELESASGFTIGEGIRRLGGDPARLEEALVPPGAVAGFLELHVEQGAVLENSEDPGRGGGGNRGDPSLECDRSRCGQPRRDHPHGSASGCPPWGRAAGGGRESGGQVPSREARWPQ